MKLIGLLGGTSWHSTVLYYEKLNQLVHNRLGEHHSARILLYSIDYNTIKTNYLNNWKLVTETLYNEINLFLTKKPDCLILCNNTLLKAFDSFKDNLNLQIPFFHAGNLAVKNAVENDYKSILLLGTKFTMEDGFYAQYFKKNNIAVTTPSEKDRLLIQSLQTKISSGTKDDNFYHDFAAIIARYKNIDAVCLACTELPLYINRENCALPLILPLDLQCEEAIEYCLSED